MKFYEVTLKYPGWIEGKTRLKHEGFEPDVEPVERGVQLSFGDNVYLIPWGNISTLRVHEAAEIEGDLPEPKLSGVGKKAPKGKNKSV